MPSSGCAGSPHPGSSISPLTPLACKPRQPERRRHAINIEQANIKKEAREFPASRLSPAWLCQAASAPGKPRWRRAQPDPGVLGHPGAGPVTPFWGAALPCLGSLGLEQPVGSESSQQLCWMWKPQPQHRNRGREPPRPGQASTGHPKPPPSTAGPDPARDPPASPHHLRACHPRGCSSYKCSFQPGFAELLLLLFEG